MRRVAIGLLLVAIAAGTIGDRPPAREPLTLDGYRVLAADFHIHSSTWSDGALTPWGLVLEAERQGLDAIAVTGHNQVSDAKVARWFAKLIGGPVVIVGQEAVAPGHHVIAIGIEEVVDSQQDVAQQAADIHRQGGIAIAAHPTRKFWPGFSQAAIAALDGAEICDPFGFGQDQSERTLERFAARGSFAAIGSSDFHALGRIGMCRTYIFSANTTTSAILDAVRARRTVVYGHDGRVYGDPSLARLAAGHPELRQQAVEDLPPTGLELFGRFAGLIGLAGLVLTQTRWFA